MPKGPKLWIIIGAASVFLFIVCTAAMMSATDDLSYECSYRSSGGEVTTDSQGNMQVSPITSSMDCE